ncbi:MAG TPA: 4Fe-4S binding protein [Nitrospirota bacterium]
MKATAKFYRQVVQAGFALFILWIGFRFWEFVRYFDTGGKTAPVPHPSGAEGFLPIGALTGVKYWMQTGTIHYAHPAAVIIFAGALAVSLVFHKSFCGWICPVGFVSDNLYKPWFKIFKKNVEPPMWVDWGLRTLKYVLAFFFVWAIIVNMDAAGVLKFLEDDYWKVADVKMLRFFTNISMFALTVILILGALSVPMRMFWCRYLCPYGALTGLFGMLSPFRITRDKEKCIGCEKCRKHCPAHLPVDTADRIISPECTSCMTCVSVCPTAAVSSAMIGKKKRALPAWGYPLVVLGVFLGIYLVALATDNWHSKVTQQDYWRLVPKVEGLEHP